MARKKVANTFTKGLVMDLNPMTTPNNILTNCLNGTIITYNGNEYMLQSDMGNGRVETAYLPAGFVPVGMVEFGGIIYVTSYNPLMDRCQIGSFPSPERNIDSTEISPFTIILSNADFNITGEGAQTFYVQKDLHDIRLFPGDKFIVYAAPGDVTGNHNRLYDCYQGEITNKMVELSIATLTDEGKVVKLTNLRQYNVGGGTYIIPEMTRQADGTPNLDSYRDITSSPYNVFNNRVSGKLILVAELLTIDSFNVSIDYIMDDEGRENEKIKDIQIVVYIEYESKDEVHMYAMQAELRDTGGGGGDYHYYWAEGTAATPGQDGPNCVRSNTDPISLYMVEQYDTVKREKRTLYYSITPCMFFGPIPYLKRSGAIQIDKIGTGFMELYEWRYYIDNDYIQLSWAMQSYPESGYYIDQVNMYFSCYTEGKDEDGNTTDEDGNTLPPELTTVVWHVSKKKSYNGSFTEMLPFDKEHYKISEGLFERDRLYFVTIEVEYKREGSEDTAKYKYFHRWMYTNGMFNKTYIEAKIVDFIELYPEMTIHNNIEYTFTEPNVDDIIEGEVDEDGEPLKKKSDISVYGRVFTRLSSLEDENVPPSECETASIEQHFRRVEFGCTITPEVKMMDEMYEIFCVDETSVKQNVTMNNDGCDVTFSDYTIEYVGNNPSSNREQFLELKENKDYAGLYKTRKELEDIAKEDPCQFVGADEANTQEFNAGIHILDGELNGEEMDGLVHIGQYEDEEGNLVGEPIEIDCIDYVKCFCNLKRQMVTFQSRMRPVIYDTITAAQYNIAFVNGAFEFDTMVYWTPRMWRNAHGELLFGYFANSEGTDYTASASGRDNYETSAGGNEGEDISFSFFNEAIQNTINDTWAKRTDSTVICALHFMPDSLWDKDKEYSAFAGKSVQDADKPATFEPLNPTPEWEQLFRLLDTLGSNEECFSQCFQDDQAVNSNNRAVIMFVKSDKGNYLPINFIYTTRGSDGASHASSFTEFGYAPAIGQLGGKIRSLAEMVVVLFNQMYMAENTVTQEACYVPDTIFYIPEYETHFNVNVDAKIEYQGEDTEYTDGNGLVVRLHFGAEDEHKQCIPINEELMQELYDKNQEYIANTDNDLYPELGVENAPEVEVKEITDTGTPHPQIQNNIIFHITKEDGKITAAYIMYESGIALRNYYADSQAQSYGALVIYNDGTSDKSDRLFGDSVYYKPKDDDFVRLDEKFKVYGVESFEATASGEFRYIYDEDIDMTGNSFRDKFKMVDNRIVLFEAGNTFNRQFGHVGPTDRGTPTHKRGIVHSISNFAPIASHQLLED